MKRKQIGVIDRSNPEDPFIKLSNEKSFKQDLGDFKDGQRVWIEVSTYYRKRSLEQNNALHWYFKEISDETGIEFDEVKDQMAKKFLMTDVLDKNGDIVADPETGEVMRRQLSTTELSTVQFMDYMDRVRLWANEFLNMELPEPDKNYKLKL